MDQKLTPEQVAALNQSPGEPLRVVDPTAQRVYFVVEESFANRAMQAIEEQETWNELQDSIAQADAGDTVSLPKADEQVRRAGLPERRFP